MSLKKNGVSVIVPMFNRERYIKQCLDSILAQDYNECLEVIVVDDGSIDRSLDIVRQYGDKVRLIEKKTQSNEQGAAAARNRGLAVAECKFIAFLDSDDYYLPGYISRMVQELSDHPEAGYAFCRCKKEVMDSSGLVSLHDWTRHKLSHLDKVYHVLSRSYCINTNVIFLRASVLDQVGQFDTLLSNGEDSDLWIRVSEVSVGRFVDIYGAVYRTNHDEAQLTGVDTKTKKSCSDIIYAKAFSRSYASESVDKLRLLLIIRALLYGARPTPHSRVKRVLGHACVLLKMFVVSPKETIRFVCKRCL